MKSCDECDFQEEGGHYCLLHSKIMKNMNIKRCKDWEEKKEAPMDDKKDKIVN